VFFHHRQDHRLPRSSASASASATPPWACKRAIQRAWRRVFSVDQTKPMTTNRMARGWRDPHSNSFSFGLRECEVRVIACRLCLRTVIRLKFCQCLSDPSPRSTVCQ
jgi:hypothetical protein